MDSGAWLNEKVIELVPSPTEVAAVQEAVDRVARVLDDHGAPWRIAERYPCGSFAKRSMLAGRKEADIVLVLRDAVRDSSLDDLAGLLDRQLTLDGRAEVKAKAVGLQFPNGVKIDVLPTWSGRLSEPSGNVPDKLKVGLNGRKHVEWFKTQAHESVIQPTVRLLKHFRDTHAEWRPLRSFALEVLGVSVLRGTPGLGLVDAFTTVLRAVRDGGLALPTGPGQRAGAYARLLDPADAANDLLLGVDAGSRSAISGAADSALRMIDAGAWSRVFPAGRQAPPPGGNIGGQTLA